MSDPTTTSAADTKSPLASTTIQGAIVMILSSMAPLLASYLKVDATQVVAVISAVTTICGFAMTVIGRMKATKTIA